MILILKNQFIKKYFILILLIIFIILCEIFTLSSAIIVNGVFSYDSSKIPLQHPQNSIVSKVFVKNGDEVILNDKIIELDAVKEINDRNIMKFKLLNSILEKQILELENHGVVNGKIVNLNLQNKLILKNFSQGEIQEFSMIIATSQQLIKSFINKYLNDINILNDKKNNYYISIKSNKLKLGLIKKQITNLQKLLDKNYIDENLLHDLTKQELDIILQIKTFNNEIAILNKQQKILRDESIIELSKKIIEKNLEVNINTRQLAINNDILQKTTIYAPINGFIEDLTIFHRGNLVEAGKIIAYIVPKYPQLNIIAKLKAVDIDNVKLNQKVEIFLKNFHDKNVPKITGEIFSISRDAKFDEILGQYFYELKISIKNDSIKNLNVIAGMPIDGFILQKDRSILSYIYNPILKSIKYSLN